MKIYIIAAVVAAVFFAYMAGSRIAREQCRAKQNADAIVAQNESIKIKRKINEKVFNTGVHDIRNRLRDKYTIAE